ncbi:MAG: hypothetical protein HY007_01695 [Candidatus Sungbacteria bacterium]|nr:hypothetical protein [Candidatus Sungbacteria bacterium]
MQGALRFLFTQEEPQPSKLEIGAEGRHILEGQRDIWTDPRDGQPLYIICQTIEEIKGEALRACSTSPQQQGNKG